MSLGTINFFCSQTEQDYFVSVSLPPVNYFYLLYFARLCEPLDKDNVNDVATFANDLSGNFAGVVQYNKDNRAFEVSEHI